MNLWDMLIYMEFSIDVIFSPKKSPAHKSSKYSVTANGANLDPGLLDNQN